MKSNSKQVRELIKQHILDCVYNDAEQTYNTIEEACKRLHNEFNRVANYPNNLQRFPNNQDRFSDYLKGIPFNFEYNYEGIETFLKGLGINPNNKEYDYDQQEKQYHYLIYSTMIGVLNKSAK
jgi:hypothetical protein